jgi:cystathionine beta-lyase/cystathionine gamma-synthase
MIHGKHRSEKWDYDHHVIPPKTASTTFRLDSVGRGKRGFTEFGVPKDEREGRRPTYIYDRLDEPTIAMLEDQIREAEGGEAACAFACGMAAISAVFMTATRTGGNIIAHPTMYGCTYSLLSNRLPRFGIETRFVDVSNPDALLAAVDSRTGLVYLETPANPTLECLDIAAIRETLAPVNARRHPEDQVLIVVDNTFQTFWGQRPLELGADIVVASLTKGVGGFGVDMGGMVVSPARFDSPLRCHRKDFGGVLPPATAWNYLVYGVPTLPIRVDRQVETALEVARFLEGHTRVARVHYPGLDSFPWAGIARRQMTTPEGIFCPGTMIYFEVNGEDLEQARKSCEAVINRLAADSYSFTLAVSLGMTKSLVEAPGLMTHSALDPCAQSKAGIHIGAVRLSIGLESSQDLIRDLESALAKA